MSEKTIDERYNETWEHLIEISGSPLEANKIARTIRDFWATVIPNVKVSRYEKGNPVSYESTLEGFPSMSFATELEANLANAIYLIYKASGQEFNRNKFEMTFNVCLTLLNIESDWRY